MDLGVGSFIFSQGIVAANPLVKDPSYLSSSTIPKVARAARKVLPLLALGLARVLFVKGTAYPVSWQSSLAVYLETTNDQTRRSM